MLTTSNNGNGTSNNGAPGKWAKKNKNRRRNKGKKNGGSKSSDNQLDDNNRPRSNSINGHKRIHDNDEDNDVSPHKKQRRKSSDTQYTYKRSWAHEILYIIFFALGMCVTLPLLFTTFSYISCGGRSGVDNMVDLVLIEKAREGDDSIVDMMKILKSKTVGDKVQQKGNEQEEVEPATIDIHESMCHVSFIAIGNFIHYLPYAQFLAYSNPFKARVDLVEIATTQEEKQEGKKGIFKRIVSRHRKRHIESEEQHHHQESAASEEIDRKHPIRHILEGASIFSQHRKQKKLERKEKKREKKELKKMKGKQASTDKEVVEIDWKKWKYAMSDDYELKTSEVSLVKELAVRVINRARKNTVCKDTTITNCSDSEKEVASLSGGRNLPHKSFQERLDSVPWGGVETDANRWWPRKDNDKDKISSQSEGGRVLASYLKIMKWPADLKVKYPFKLCKDGCDSEVSLLHTLEWREKYKPWCMSPKAVQFNNAGFVYTRGHSKPGPKQRLEAEMSNDVNTLANGGHSMVWYRPGLASPSEDPELYGRTMVNTLEMAVSDSLARNKGTIGRFNVIMDCSGMGSKNSPSIANVKKLFGVLQDHFPDRLGVLLAANLSGMTQMLMKMVLPFVTEDVRAKIHIIPNDEEGRREMLTQFMDESEIPYALGGIDGYMFDANDYYEGKCILPEEGILEYVETMPYHA